MRRVVKNRTSMPGCASRNRGSRWISQCAAKDGSTLMVSVAGPVNPDVVFEQVRRAFGGLPEGEPPPALTVHRHAESGARSGPRAGFVLGGVQALSRSLYGTMIPEEASAEFYGYYSVYSKFSAIWGP